LSIVQGRCMRIYNPPEDKNLNLKTFKNCKKPESSFQLLGFRFLFFFYYLFKLSSLEENKNFFFPGKCNVDARRLLGPNANVGNHLPPEPSSPDFSGEGERGDWGPEAKRYLFIKKCRLYTTATLLEQLF